MVLGAPVSGLAAGLAFDGSTSGPVTMKSPLIIRRVSVVIGAFPSPPSASRRDRRRVGVLELEPVGQAAAEIARAAPGAVRFTGRRSGKLLHHDPVALDFVQIELDRCCRLG
jgi:hypothetical protein